MSAADCSDASRRLLRSEGMAALPDIDAAIGRLDAALRGAGLPGLEQASDTDSIAAVADHVAPYVLPAELRSFWEQVDPDPVAVYTFPMLHGPAHALEQLRMLGELGQEPRWGRLRCCFR